MVSKCKTGASVWRKGVTGGPPSSLGSWLLHTNTMCLVRFSERGVPGADGALAAGRRHVAQTLTASGGPWAQTVLGIILGGGAGSRLYPLTKKRAKPAVPLGANYRLIDIPVSNCINSNVNKIYCLTQARPPPRSRPSRRQALRRRLRSRTDALLCARVLP